MKSVTIHTLAGPQTLRVGDSVRVLGVPPLWYKDIAPGEYDETTVVLERCVGRVYPISAIDEYGTIWINCTDDGSPCTGGLDHNFRIELFEIVTERGDAS